MNLFGLISLLPAVPETRQSKLRTTVSFRDGRRKNLKEEGELVVSGQAADAKSEEQIVKARASPSGSKYSHELSNDSNRLGR